MPGTLRVLTIDGGGIRGIIPAMILEHIESRTGRRTAELFHLVAGTSTGGMIAFGLARPRGDGRPMPAAEIVRVLRDRGAQVFSRTVWKEVSSLGGIVEEKYDSEALERFLETNLGDSRLSESVPDVMATAYDLRRRTPYFFKSWKAQGLQLEDGEHAERHEFLMRDAARATTAAPTYFEPAAIRNALGEKFLFVDGGVYANNPAMCAYVSARRLFPDADRILMVSLSTGLPDLRLPYEEAGSWGLAAWARPVLDMIIDGVGHTVHRHMSDLLGEDYFRFWVDLKPFSADDPGPSHKLDDSSAVNLRRLQRKAQSLLEKADGRMDELIERLAKEPFSVRRDMGYPATGGGAGRESVDTGAQAV